MAATTTVRTTATNHWLGQHLGMDSRFHLSRQLTAWRHHPDPKLARIVGLGAHRKA
ncbi:MAG TPA: hypothetical protein VHD32_14390 [Candidatus Didemnitutus sp.]|nr:hypothetical protein [Candidatus Didemnitutus sp.]